MKWTASKMKTQPGYCSVVYGDHGYAVAMKHPEGDQRAWDVAAPIIAAAPDLLAACKTALDRFQTLEDAEEATDADIAARCEIQDAIRRAETGAP